MTNILHKFARHFFEKCMTTEIMACSMWNFRQSRRSNQCENQYTYHVKRYLLCHINNILMGSCNGMVNHSQYHQFFQRILQSFFPSQQDLLQMTRKIHSFVISFWQAARCCQNAIVWCDMSEQALLHYKIIKNRWGY